MKENFGNLTSESVHFTAVFGQQKTTLSVTVVSKYSSGPRDKWRSCHRRDKHVTIGQCNYHALAIRHIRHLLTTQLAQTLACSLILSRIDYCNAVLHGAPYYSIKTLQRVQNNATRIILQEPRQSHATPLLKMLHWLPVQQRIDYRVGLLTFKVRSTSTPLYEGRSKSSATRP